MAANAHEVALLKYKPHFTKTLKSGATAKTDSGILAHMKYNDINK